MPLKTGKGKIIDWDNNTCLQCKRQFQTQRGLYEHLVLSKQHKKKQEKLQAFFNEE